MRLVIPCLQKPCEFAKQSDAILLGAIGGPKWEHCRCIFAGSGSLAAFTQRTGPIRHLWPCFLFPGLTHASTLKEEVIAGVDLIVIRELTGGLYFGEKSRENIDGGVKATDILSYSTYEIERIVRYAYEVARKRNHKLCSVDKANVIETSRLWRETVTELAKEYPDVETSHMYVDNLRHATESAIQTI